MGPLDEARKKHIRDKRKAEIDVAAAKLPPRVEYQTRRIPALAPIPQPVANSEWHVFELNKRPEHRVINVHLPSISHDNIQAIEQFRVLEYRLDCHTWPAGGTSVRWWGFDPVRDALKPEVRHTLNRACAYVERVRMALDWLRPYFGRTGLCPIEWTELNEWVNVVIEDCEQALGKP